MEGGSAMPFNGVAEHGNAASRAAQGRGGELAMAMWVLWVVLSGRGPVGSRVACVVARN